MQPVRILAVTLVGCLAFRACPAADFVTEPQRKYGLGDLLQATVSPEGRYVLSSPDGTRILTTHGAPNHVAQLWNTETGQIEREFGGHSGWLLAAKFSPDGRRIATGAQDGSARLWDVASRE